jgi:hypothetical protein
MLIICTPHRRHTSASIRCEGEFLKVSSSRVSFDLLSVSARISNTPRQKLACQKGKKKISAPHFALREVTREGRCSSCFALSRRSFTSIHRVCCAISFQWIGSWQWSDFYFFLSFFLCEVPSYRVLNSWLMISVARFHLTWGGIMLKTDHERGEHVCC